MKSAAVGAGQLLITWDIFGNDEIHFIEAKVLNNNNVIIRRFADEEFTTGISQPLHKL